MEPLQLSSWQFARENDRMAMLVLEGKKTAATFLYECCMGEGQRLPVVGEEELLLFDNEKKAGITRTTKVVVTAFKNITGELARLEGLGDGTLDDYRQFYHRCFAEQSPDFTPETQVVFKIFELVEDLTKTRLERAARVAAANPALFGGGVPCIQEVNAGFKNDIFELDGRYILKICTNPELEKGFAQEAAFLEATAAQACTPRLYRYDDSKAILPFVYEIMQKVPGRSLYYYWYKMSEPEREETIKKLAAILKVLHEPAAPYDWPAYLQGRLTGSYRKASRYFSREERETVEAAFGVYAACLAGGMFATIHGDLHFDNILVDDAGNLVLIDFNDMTVAPIDYDLRLLYMCKETPWKWANTEMDPYQKPEDFRNIDRYLEEQYAPLAATPHLRERMTIYRIVNDMSLLARFGNLELKDRVVQYSRSLL